MARRLRSSSVPATIVDWETVVTCIPPITLILLRRPVAVNSTSGIAYWRYSSTMYSFSLGLGDVSRIRFIPHPFPHLMVNYNDPAVVQADFRECDFGSRLALSH